MNVCSLRVLYLTASASNSLALASLSGEHLSLAIRAFEASITTRYASVIPMARFSIGILFSASKTLIESPWVVAVEVLLEDILRFCSDESPVSN